MKLSSTSIRHRLTSHFGMGRLLTLAVFATLGAGHAAADWITFCHNIRVGYDRNRAWPNPFNEADAMQVVAPFHIMKNNGWRAHNTIGSDLFRRGDGALLASGRNRVQWIATQAPQSRRTIYVLRGDNQAETESRVAAVRDTIGKLYIDGAKPQVMVTNIEPATQPGPFVTKINRDRLEQMPAPKLPSTSAAGTSGATESGSGGGGL